jgi:hypothetical protein
MPETKKPTDVRAMAAWVLRIVEEAFWRVTKAVRAARVGLEGPTSQKSTHRARPAPAARRPKRAATRKAA